MQCNKYEITANSVCYAVCAVCDAVAVRTYIRVRVITTRNVSTRSRVRTCRSYVSTKERERTYNM
jgi:hypothetical protein